MSAPLWLKRKVVSIPKRRVSTAVAPAALVRYGPAAAAVVVILAVGAAMFPRNSAKTTGSPIASALRDEASASPGPRLLAPRADAEPSARHINFRWSPVPGATRYTLSLLNDRGDIVLRRTGTEHELRVDAAVAGLHHGAPYFWDVQATFSDGGTASSAIERFIWRGR